VAEQFVQEAAGVLGPVGLAWYTGTETVGAGENGPAADTNGAKGDSEMVDVKTEVVSAPPVQFKREEQDLDVADDDDEGEW